MPKNDDEVKDNIENRFDLGRSRVRDSRNPEGRPFYDMSNSYTTKGKDTRGGHVIQFYSIPTGESLSFKAFLTQFEDQYSSEWNDTPSFGRMDPIHTFKRTSRTISLGWDVPAASVNEAKLNLLNAQKLLSLLYPVYDSFDLVGLSPDGAQAAVDKVNLTFTDDSVGDELKEEVTRAAQEVLLRAQKQQGVSRRKVGVMVSAPLFKLKFSNLIMDNGDDAEGFAGSAESSGLVGTLSGLTYSPDIEQGFFGNTVLDDVREGTLLPQTIKFSCEFTVMHTSPLGYEVKKPRGQKGHKRSKNFPYHAEEVPGDNDSDFGADEPLPEGD